MTIYELAARYIININMTMNIFKDKSVNAYINTQAFHTHPQYDNTQTSYSPLYSLSVWRITTL